MQTHQERSAAVIEAVTSAEGVDPVELSEPLYTAINPDALDTLFRTDTGHVTFPYQGYEVTVFSDSEVTIKSLAPD